MKNLSKQILSVLAIALFLFLLFVIISRGQGVVQPAGGPFVITKSVIAGGGQAKEASPVAEDATAGQAIAGHYTWGGQFTFYSGFWTPDDLIPLAGGVVISGRVMNTSGSGIKNATVTLMSGDGVTYTATTGARGSFSFTDIPAGETYFVTVSAKRFKFPEKVINVSDAISDLDFVALKDTR